MSIELIIEINPQLVVTTQRSMPWLFRFPTSALDKEMSPALVTVQRSVYYIIRIIFPACCDNAKINASAIMVTSAFDIVSSHFGCDSAKVCVLDIRTVNAFCPCLLVVT